MIPRCNCEDIGGTYLRVIDLVHNTDNIGILSLIYCNYGSLFDNSQNLLEMIYQKK